MDQGGPAGAEPDAGGQAHEVGLMGGGEQPELAVAVERAELAVQPRGDRAGHGDNGADAAVEDGARQFRVAGQGLGSDMRQSVPLPV